MAPPQSKNPSGDRLPFEPKRRQKRSDAKASEETAAATEPQPSPAARKREDAKAAKVQAAKEKLAKMQRRAASGNQSRPQSGVPEDVSRRMLKRMLVLSGTPMLFGISVFFGSYYIVSHDLFRLPTVAVLLVSLGFFGLSVLGLSYGVLSASWDEGGEDGSLVGWQEFRLNLDRLISSWKASKESKSES